ncbi:MAG TPA: MFS transporter [Caulobacteraceae bacterium]|jgi:MFS family permease
MADVTAPVDASASAPALVAAGRRRYVLILLMIAYTLSFLDRQVLSILVEPIEHDLHITDKAIGILTGPIFVIFYTFLGIPIAWLADRFSRPIIITVSLTLWSGFTAFSGMVTSFLPLAIARLGVGFGEAGCNPSSHSLIADMSTPHQRASGLSFYSLGVPIGTLLGLAMGGLIADAYGWRTAFLVAAAPGLVLALVIAFTTREVRPNRPIASLAQAFVLPVKDLIQVLGELKSKPTFWYAALGSGFSAFVGYAYIYFTPSFFLRCHAGEVAAIAATMGLKSKGFVGPALGLMTGIGGLAGTLIGGIVADRAVTRDRRIFMSLPAITAVIYIPVVIVIFTLKSTLPAMLLLLIPNAIATVWYGPVYSTAQSVVPPHRRATAAALLLLILNLIGLGFGPTFLGALSDYFAVQQHMGPAEGLRWAMVVTGCFSILAALFFWLGRATVREDVVS